MIDKDALRDLLLTDEQLRLGDEVVKGLVRIPLKAGNVMLAVELVAELKTVRAVQAAVAILLSVEGDLPETNKSREFFSLMKESRENVLEMTLRGSESMIARE